MSVVCIAGFELGDASDLLSLAAGQTIVAGGTHGAYVLKNDGSGGARSTITFSPSTYARVRVSIRLNFASATPATNWFTDVHFFDAVSADLGGVIIWYYGPGGGSGGNDWEMYFNAGAGSQWTPNPASGYFTVTAGWHLLEIDFNTANGSISQAWFDGVLKLTTPASTIGVNQVNQLALGDVFGGTATANDVLLTDDIVVDDTNQPGDCRVIARQPASGTPTYDEFTKSSASTIDTVWSDTPLNTSTFARSAVTSSRQTGDLASFSATQSGHGTGTIGASDTIKALLGRFIAGAAALTAAGITEVGTAQSGTSTAGGNVTLTFSTAPQAGDLVIVTGGHILRTGSSYGPSTAGYTQIGSLQTSGASGTGIAFGAWYKVMGDTPDTNVVCNGTSGTAGDGVSYESKVLRQTNNAVVLDIAAVFAGPTTSTNPDPPASGTLATNNCAIVIAAASLVSDTNIGSATNYTGQATGNAGATRPYSASILHRILSGGAGTSENPPAIGSTGNAWASGIWFSVTISIRPATEAGSALSFRRRFGGSDTDEAITLGGTADNYYKTSCYSPPSLSDLNAGEIGILHGSNSIRQTISDVWLHVAYIPSGSTDYAITASFAGAGALVANLAKNKTVEAALAGAGALSGQLRQGMLVTSSFGGLGALTANLSKNKEVSASFNGVGSLIADLRKDKTVQANFAGAGSLAAQLRQGMVVNANFGGVGALLADVTVVTSSPNHLITALFAGEGSLTANLAKNKTVEAVLAGVGSLTSQINLGMIISSTFQGAGALTANLVNSKTVEANFAGTGALIAALRQGMLVNASFGGAGALTADVRRVLLVSSNFAGAGSLNASLSLNMRVNARFDGSGVIDSAIISIAGVVTDWPITATFTGVGSLASQVNLGMKVNAAFDGAGALSSALSVDNKINASFGGLGFLSAALSVNNRVQANFAGLGALTANLVNSKTVEANFAGTGALTAALLQQMKVNAALAGAGSLTANLAKNKTVSASFAGAGALTSGLNLNMSITAIFSGVGALTGLIDIQSFVANHAITALFAGAGNLTASLRQNNLVTASFAGVGVMTAFIRHNIRLTAAFAGEGLMTNAQLRQNMRVRATFQGEGLIDTSAIDVIPPVGTGQDTFFLVM
jgi:hypothetical protein